MNNKVTLITQSEYARRRGVAKSAVAKAVAEQRISLIDGKIDPAVADIQWSQNTRARADSGRPTAAHEPGGGQGAALPPDAAAALEQPPSKDASYQELRARRELAAVEREERENAKEAGRLVDRAVVERAVFDAFRQLRDAVIATGPRVSPKVVGLTDARDVEHQIVAELRKAFQGWEERMHERLPGVGQ